MGDAPRTAHTDSHAKTPASMTTRALRLGAFGTRGTTADVFFGESIPVSPWMSSGRRPIFFPSIGSSIFLTLFRSVVCCAKPNHVTAECQHVCATFFLACPGADDHRWLRCASRMQRACSECNSHISRKQVTTRLACASCKSCAVANAPRCMRKMPTIRPPMDAKIIFRQGGRKCDFARRTSSIAQTCSAVGTVSRCSTRRKNRRDQPMTAASASEKRSISAVDFVSVTHTSSASPCSE